MILADSLNTRIGELSHALSSTIDGISSLTSKIDGIAAITSMCLMVSGNEDNPCPRLIMVVPNPSPRSTPSRFSHFRRETMGKLFRRKGKPHPQCYRVRFLCPYDLTSATCGEDGQGYRVDIKDWQQWLQRFLPLIQVSENPLMRMHRGVGLSTIL